MEGVIAVAAPFVMVVAIVWLVQNGKNKRAEMASGGSREDQAIIGQMCGTTLMRRDSIALLISIYKYKDKLACELGWLEEATQKIADAPLYEIAARSLHYATRGSVRS